MYYLGLDLGSTVTKAVIMDENKSVVGKGLTHTGADVVKSSDRAKTEALIDARVNYLVGQLPEGPENFRGRLKACFQDERVFAKFEDLEERCDKIARPALKRLRRKLYQTRPDSLQEYIETAVIEDRANKAIRKSLREIEKEIPQIDFEHSIRLAFEDASRGSEMGTEEFEAALEKAKVYEFEIKNAISTSYDTPFFPFY